MTEILVHFMIISTFMNYSYFITNIIIPTLHLYLKFTCTWHFAQKDVALFQIKIYPQHLQQLLVVLCLCAHLQKSYRQARIPIFNFQTYTFSENDQALNISYKFDLELGKPSYPFNPFHICNNENLTWTDKDKRLCPGLAKIVKNFFAFVPQLFPLV